jgi:hypothetical protein
MSITSYKTGNTSPSSLLAGNAAYNPYAADILVIAGGGGAANGPGPGGGAGQVRLLSNESLTLGATYTVTIGGGGSGGAGGTQVGDNPGTDGVNSQFGSLTAASKGGGSGNYQSGISGSGLGGLSLNVSTYYLIPGGGGDTGVGDNGNQSTGTAGAGGAGNGAYSSWANATSTGVSGYYAGGGGGGETAWSNNAHLRSTRAAAASGGGGRGGVTGSSGRTNGENGTVNTGSAAGGGAYYYDGQNQKTTGGNGGSGLIILRIPGTYTAGATTGSSTRTVSGGYTYYVWTGSGSITI